MNAGAMPLEKFPGTYQKWRCRCTTCLREINPELANMRNGHNPCVYCSGKKVDKKSAREFALTRGVSPLTEFPGAKKKWKIKCLKCKRISYINWTSLQLRRKNAGCSSCTEYGFKPLEPAYLYLITHQSRHAHKIGIGNKNAKRIEMHLKNGWTIYRVLEFKKGKKAHQIEQSVIEWLRTEKTIGPAFRTGDGWTETVPSDEITLSSIFKKVIELAGTSYLKVPSKNFTMKK